MCSLHLFRMQTKAERRAEHNAIERARRENLNTKFQQLAHSLPNLQNDRRPSKGTIIERTLDFGKIVVYHYYYLLFNYITAAEAAEASFYRFANHQ